MNQLQKKYKINIPANLTILYCNKKNIITILGPLQKKSLKLKLKLQVSNKNRIIFVTKILIDKLLNSKKKIKSLQGTTRALLKQILTEVSLLTYKKLKFVGIGYKVFNTEQYNTKLLHFKLGFSHPIYFKLPEHLNVFCIKQTRLFIYGHSYNEVLQTSSIVQSLKLPDAYKGKGILDENIKIRLKEGKKKA